MTADRTPLERLRDLALKHPIDVPYITFVSPELLLALLDRAGLCETCGGQGRNPAHTLAYEPCECVTRLNEAIERELK